VRLTNAQDRMLRHAAKMPALGFDGVAVNGSQLRAADALERAGLLRFAGMGEHEEGRPCHVYEITDAGRARLAEDEKGAKP
jgi:hypothetical protein